jgi:3-oxoacyl-[acyl-carrier protein] reductase
LILNNKTSLVTGASRGIGRSIATDFIKEGATVFLNSINKNNLEKAYLELKKMGAKCFCYAADVSNENEVRKMLEYIYEKTENLDILVNNAGIIKDSTLHKMEDEYWSRVIEVNLKGVFNCCRAVLPKMRENNYGRIINIASVVGICGNFGQTNYSASKAGVIGLTKSLAYETAGKGITVNAVAPGFIETDMTKTIPEEIRQKIISKIPLKRFGSPDEVAKMVTFLASDDSSYITGQVLNVNGGFLMP